MLLDRVSAGPVGFEHQLFECPKCNNVEARVTAADPFDSTARGWHGPDNKTGCCTRATARDRADTTTRYFFPRLRVGR
jgi:hypothetical protein